MTSTDSTGTAGVPEAQLQALLARIDELEARVAGLETPEVPQEVVLAISAAVAAYLGKKATVKQVRLRRGGTWAAQGRADLQQSHTIAHGVR